LIGLLLLVAIGVGVYAYFTTPLPFGLSSVVRTPGGDVAFPASPTPVPGAPLARTPAGQALLLGATSVAVQSVTRNQDLTANNRGGPAGLYTVVNVVVQNAGSEPLTPKQSDFRLVDDRGRSYAVDLEATRSVNSTARRRLLFDASVPPSASVDTLLAFETATDASGLALRVMVGYGDVELPRQP